MSREIWKWPLFVSDLQSLSLPAGAQVLCVQVQAGEPQLWALVDSGAQREERHFATYCTGNPIPDGMGTYVGTYQIQGGDFVFHVFEVAR
jgi:hypothetical protein